MPEIEDAIAALEAALAEPQPNTLHDWVFKRNADGSIGIFAPPPKPGESQRTSDCVGTNQRDLNELLGKLADHMAALAEPVAWMRVIDEAMVTHHLGVADPADDYETAKRKMNNLLCMAQDIGNYFSKQAEPVQEPDSPERRCGGPGCDMTCCQPVQEPVAYSQGRTLHWHEGKGVSDAQLFAVPPQRKPLSGVAIYGLFVRSGLGAYHQKDFVVQTEYDRCIERFARAIERAHGIGGEG